MDDLRFSIKLSFFFFLEIVRKNSDKFIRVNEREEPPLRTLDHGLAGEFRNLESGEADPYPYVIRTKDGKCYHGFRSSVNAFCNMIC